MLRIGLLALFSLVAVSIAFPQSQQTMSSKGCAFSEIYWKDGWTIPGRPGTVDATSRRPIGSTLPDVFATKLTPTTTEATLTRIACAHDKEGRLQVDEEPIGIIWLLSYDFRGKTFAYGIRYVDEWIHDGTRRQLGSESQVVFYDLDGSGRFTLMKGPRPLLPDFIPDWVRKEVSVEHEP